MVQQMQDFIPKILEYGDCSIRIFDLTTLLEYLNHSVCIFKGEGGHVPLGLSLVCM